MYLRRQPQRQTRSHHLSHSARQVLEKFNTEPPRKISALFDEGRFVQVARQEGGKEIILFYSHRACRHLLAVLDASSLFVVTVMPLEWWRGERLVPTASEYARARSLALSLGKEKSESARVPDVPSRAVNNGEFDRPWAERRQQPAVCALLAPRKAFTVQAVAA